MMCGGKYQSGGVLKKHINSVHNGKKPYKCTICEHNCSTNTQLNVHISAVHEGNKPHKCLNCDASFAYGQELRKHEESGEPRICS